MGHRLPGDNKAASLARAGALASGYFIRGIYELATHSMTDKVFYLDILVCRLMFIGNAFFARLVLISFLGLAKLLK